MSELKEDATPIEEKIFDLCTSDEAYDQPNAIIAEIKKIIDAAHARKTDPTRVLLGQLLHDTRLINDGHFMSKLNEAYQNG